MADRTVDGARLRDLRERKLLTQRDLALNAKVSERTVKYAESGNYKSNWTNLTLYKLADALGVDVSEFVIDQEQAKDAA